AIAGLQEALDAFHIRGISHNVAFLAAVLAHPRFAEGRLSTAFIDEEFPDGYGERALSDDELPVFLAVAGAVHCRAELRKAALSKQPTDGRPASQSCIARMNGKGFELDLFDNSEACSVQFKLGRKTHKLEVSSDWSPGNALFRGRLDGREVCFQVDRDGIGWRLFHGGVDAKVTLLPRRTAELLAQMPEKEAPDLSRLLLSPMPGLLIRLAVSEGEEVKAGEELAVVEAMKMENVLRAERDGIVRVLHAGIGDSLAVDQSILEFE
ncbi:MAG: acetyl/propionyl-CoA carboxylase subunit alpha, partial [Alphaproteobacteria bacterium]|nr:acetyl/propionyl-CoA carboxylase subunit alpha [Alphaproteobacteria bacterium]